jgi:predicted Zn finger-like uncharacterized protein
MITECANCRSRFTVPDDPLLAEAGIRCPRCDQPVTKLEEVTQVTRPKFSFEYVERDKTERPAAAAFVPPTVQSAVDPAPVPSGTLATELFGDLNLPDAEGSAESPGGLLHEAMFELSMQAQTATVPKAGSVALPTEARSAFLARQAQARAQEALDRPGLISGAPARLAQLLFAVFLALLFVATLRAYLNDGHFELSSLSWQGFQAFVHSPGEIVAVDLSSGLYDTRAGKPVFYLRGAVENRGSEARKVKVRAEILDGTQTIRSVDAFAGANYTPEDLYRIEAAADAESLNLQAVSGKAKVEPGGKLPFFLVFYDYPPDLWAYRLKVTATGLLPGVAALP